MAKRKGSHLAVYNASGITLSDGDETGLFVDSTGALLISATISASDIQIGAVEIKDGTTDARVTAKVDNAAAGTPTPMSVGGKYNASAPTYDDGDQFTLQGDVNGNTKIREQYAPAYEDNTAQVAKVEHRYTSFSVTADTQIKSGAGFVHTVTLSPTAAVPTAGLITFYDSLTETGTVIHSEWVFATSTAHTITLDASFATGLFVGFDGTAANIRASGSYR